MLKLAIISCVVAILAIGCSKSDEHGETVTCGGSGALTAACLKRPAPGLDKVLRDAVTPGVMPDGTRARALTPEEKTGFLSAYGRALVYDNSLDELVKEVRKSKGAGGKLADREKKMRDSLKAKCAIGSRNSSSTPVGERGSIDSVDYFIESGRTGTCPLTYTITDSRQSDIGPVTPTVTKTTGLIKQNANTVVQDPALLEELGLVSQEMSLRADTEFIEDGASKTTSVQFQGTSQVADRHVGPYRVEALGGSYQVIVSNALEFLESKGAFVYRMKGYDVLLQVFGAQKKGEPAMTYQAYLNGAELSPAETAKLRR